MTIATKTPPRERLVVIETADGPMRAFVARPDSAGPFAAVVMVQHIGGLSETMRIVAVRVTRLGLICIVPDLYHRLGHIVIDPVDPEPSIAAIRQIAVANVTPPRLKADIGATLAWLRADESTLPGARGLIGFGGGAAQAMRVAADFSADIHALISILGVGFVKPDDPDSPHLRLAELAGEAYFGFAGNDAIIPASAVETLRAMLAASPLPHEIVVHPDVAHGYLFSNRAAYVPAAAEDDWRRVSRIFARRLPGFVMQE